MQYFAPFQIVTTKGIMSNESRLRKPYWKKNHHNILQAYIIRKYSDWAR
jgi:hypothetical protein